MATNITVTLTDEQVAKALQYARKIFPEATTVELRSKLEEAATHGPGVYSKIGEWEYEAIRQHENEQREESLEEFESIFPPAPDPEPTPQ